MGVLNRPTARLGTGRPRTGTTPPNSPAPSSYAPGRRPLPGNGGPVTRDRRPRPDRGVQTLRDLARQGRLATVAAAAEGAERRALTGAAYDVVWPIVFSQLTRRFEQRRGHHACAVSVERLADACLDRFHDDVEAVVDDLLTHARHPVLDLEAWIASRLNAATVNGHRRLRGQRGALQRPRLPRWLGDALGNDRWLTALATDMLVWVGVTATAGSGVWPLEAWAQRRGTVTGDWPHSDPAVVARDVETVLAAMRRRPSWYESYVERPLGRKQAPVAPVPLGDVPYDSARPLTLGGVDDQIDAGLMLLAAEAVRVIDDRIGRGEPADAVVIDVVNTVFGPVGERIRLDHPPYGGADEYDTVAGALADRVTVDRIVATVLGIIREHRPIG